MKFLFAQHICYHIGLFTPTVDTLRARFVYHSTELFSILRHRLNILWAAESHMSIYAHEHTNVGKITKYKNKHGIN